MVETTANKTEELIDTGVAHKFTKYDWYGWAGASVLPDGSGPFISNNERFTVLLGGPTDGYLEPGSNHDCDIQVDYYINDDINRGKVGWDKCLPDFEKNREGYVRLFNSLCRMMNEKDMTEEVVDSFCAACEFDKILP